MKVWYQHLRGPSGLSKVFHGIRCNWVAWSRLFPLLYPQLASLTGLMQVSNTRPIFLCQRLPVQGDVRHLSNPPAMGCTFLSPGRQLLKRCIFESRLLCMYRQHQQIKGRDEKAMRGYSKAGGGVPPVYSLRNDQCLSEADKTCHLSKTEVLMMEFTCGWKIREAAFFLPSFLYPKTLVLISHSGSSVFCPNGDHRASFNSL